MDTKGGKAVGGWGGGGGMNWAIRIDMYTLMCIKLMTNKNLVYKKRKKKKEKSQAIAKCLLGVRVSFIENHQFRAWTY